MARIGKLPQQAIIDGFKGVIDYYLWKGIPCVRKWPHWRKRAPYPAEKANQDLFGQAAKLWKPLPEYVKQQFNDMAAGTSFTGRDLFTRGYIIGERL